MSKPKLTEPNELRQIRNENERKLAQGCKVLAEIYSNVAGMSNCFIAGGALRDYDYDFYINDIDIFICLGRPVASNDANLSVYALVETIITGLGYTRSNLIEQYDESEFLSRRYYRDSDEINIIYRSEESISDVLLTFPVACSQIAFNPKLKRVLVRPLYKKAKESGRFIWVDKTLDGTIMEANSKDYKYICKIYERFENLDFSIECDIMQIEEYYAKENLEEYTIVKN